MTPQQFVQRAQEAIKAAPAVEINEDHLSAGCTVSVQTSEQLCAKHGLPTVQVSFCSNTNDHCNLHVSLISYDEEQMENPYSTELEIFDDALNSFRAQSATVALYLEWFDKHLRPALGITQTLS